MSMQFPNLFSPIKIGPKTVKNRIVSTGHRTRYVVDSMISDRLVAYHRERAKGGVGLIITESSSVHPSYVGYNFPELFLYNHDDRIIPWFQKLSDALHEYDTKIITEISHGGAAGVSAPMYPLLAPSASIPETVCEMSRELEVDEIQEIVEAFGQATRRAKEGGLDGVEIQGGHGNLITQFMTPYSNRRTDEYGGSFDNCLRFALEVIDCVRENAGNDFVVGMRISGDELVDGGQTLEDMKKIAPILAAKVDYLNVSFSHFAEYMSTGMQVSTMAVPLGAFVYLAAGIKEVVNIPVIAVGRINDPVQAEKILADGYADLVGMTRALLCDPELPNKAKEGKLEDIRNCVACGLGCVGHIATGTPITCIQNPTVGREREWSSIEPAKSKKKVVVVGGGPAGMEAAWATARRGHQVVLFEKERQVGGQVLIAAKAPFRTELGDVARNLSRQLEQEKEKVTVKLSVEATADIILAENPDAVIVAAGSTPFIPPIPGVGNANVVTDWDVLEEEVEIGNKAMVLDGEGSQRACSVAEFLADKGKQVEILTRQFYVGATLHVFDKSLALQRLLQKEVVFKPLTWVREIRKREVVTYHTLTRVEEVVPVDTVVLALGGEANHGLYRELKGKVKELYAIGDCLGPRKLEPAIYEGFSVGVSL